MKDLGMTALHVITKSLFNRDGRGCAWRRRRPATAGVEALEARLSLSSFWWPPDRHGSSVGVGSALATNPGVVRGFNPQPDPPTRSATIIAI
jgi:hypothetical protein